MRMMDDRQYSLLVRKMMEYDPGTPERTQHFLKVHAFARLIGTGEGLDEETMYILETAALLHDIGIRNALRKYDTDAGPYQEKEGPGEARVMLEEAGGYTEEQIERICYLIGHHHTYTDIQGMDYRILVEADFLVNLYENNAKYTAILNADRNIFRTETGEWMLKQMFSGQLDS